LAGGLPRIDPTGFLKMLLSRINERIERYSERKLAGMSEIERRDVLAFDDWFLRRRGWQWLIWIFVAATLLATLAAQMPWQLKLIPTILLFNVFAFAIAWGAFCAWFGYRRLQGKLLQITIFCLVVLAIVLPLVITLLAWVHGDPPLGWVHDDALLRHVSVATFIFAFLYLSLAAIIAALRNREHVATARHLEAEARRSELSRRLAESELKLLQSQVEPHFLFNTLGTAQQLAEKGAPEAARLIADLIRFLRAATPALRRAATTLGDERRMIAAYLAIMRTRLAARLSFRIDIGDAFRAIPVPPGMLITLVENAVKHGIELAPDGGEIHVVARRRPLPDDRLELTVTDTGAGLGVGTPGQGIGLANIRERLELLHGARAALELEENVPRGFVARVLLPVDWPHEQAMARSRADSLEMP
jgi:signal transduction histidine kinase